MKTTKIYELVKNVCAAAGVNSGFVNLTVDPKKIRHYTKIDGLDLSSVTTLIECVTISQIKSFGIDPAAYSLKNTDGLAGRFLNTRNYVFPLYALEQLFSSEDYARFYENYSKAIIERYEVKTTVKEEKKAPEKKESKILSMTKALIAPTSKRIAKADSEEKKSVKATEEKAAAKADPVKTEVKTEVKAAEVIPMNAAKVEKAEKKTESKVLPISEKIIVSGSPKNKEVVEKAINDHLKVAPVKVEEKKPEEKKEEKTPVEVSKSVTVDSAYIENLIAAAPVKKSKTKKRVNKADLEQIAALF